jgi:hypothetical protein
MTPKWKMVSEPATKSGLSRRAILAAASITGSSLANGAFAETLADVPARGPGDQLSGRSERSKYVVFARVDHAAQRNGGARQGGVSAEL